MVASYVDTNKCSRVKLGGAQGQFAEIVNKDLCGAENVVGSLRWLHKGERFDTESLEDTHQLIYLIEGDGVITLKDKDYEVLQGAGIYLEPREIASVRPAGLHTLRLLHLIVPRLRD
jgi:hypothetical protein